jgi:hypothetical protein
MVSDHDDTHHAERRPWPAAALIACVVAAAISGCALSDSPDASSGFWNGWPESPGDSITAVGKLADLHWSADNVTLFAMATLSGETQRSLVAINTVQLSVRKLVAMDSVRRFAFAKDSSAVYGLIAEPATASNPKPLGLVRLVRIDIATGAKTTITSFHDDFDKFSADGSRLAYRSYYQGSTSLDTVGVLDVASGNTVAAMTFPTTIGSVASAQSAILQAMSPDGSRLLIQRLPGSSTSFGHLYPPLLFDWNVTTGQIDSAPGFDAKHSIAAAAWSGGFKLAYIDGDTTMLGPNAGLRDVSFGGTDTTTYLRIVGSRFPDRISWVPAKRLTWTAVQEHCLDDSCESVSVGIYLSTPTSVVQIGSINTASAFSLWASPNGRSAVVEVIGRGLFILRR